MGSTAPVFDYFPRGMPPILNEPMREVMQAVLDDGPVDGPTGRLAIDTYRDEEVRQFRTDPAYAERMHQAWLDAGVNLVSPTVGRGQLNNPVRYGERVRQHLARWQARIDSVDWLEKATSPDRAQALIDDGKVGVVLNTQNLPVEVFDDLDELERLYNFGVRIMQLTYNTGNLIGSSSSERVDGGLTAHGLEVVERLNDLGVVIDLSHCGRRTVLDTVEATEVPVAATHTSARALEDHPRAKHDDELEAIASVDGYVGLIILPTFVSPDDPDSTYERWFDHVAHVVDIVGIDRVGVGTDWGRWTAEQPDVLKPYIAASYDGGSPDDLSRVGLTFGEMREYADWRVIPEGLEAHGFTADEVDQIIGGNFMAFWRRVAS